MAALVARICGLARSTFGGRGGRAATCGDAASADKSFADGAVEAGTTTGGVSPSAGCLCGNGGAFEVLGDSADIIACLCIGVQMKCEGERCDAKRREACCARHRRATAAIYERIVGEVVGIFARRCGSNVVDDGG